MEASLIDRYGRTKIAEIVVGFYGEILGSPTLGHYFGDANMELLVDHQAMFMATFMGGPPSFTPDQVQATHRPMHISEADFDEMLRIIGRWLARYGVTPEDTATLLARYQSMRAQIVAPPQGG